MKFGGEGVLWDPTLPIYYSSTLEILLLLLLLLLDPNSAVVRGGFERGPRSLIPLCGPVRALRFWGL